LWQQATGGTNRRLNDVMEGPKPKVRKGTVKKTKRRRKKKREKVWRSVEDLDCLLNGGCPAKKQTTFSKKKNTRKIGVRSNFGLKGTARAGQNRGETLPSSFVKRQKRKEKTNSEVLRVEE